MKRIIALAVAIVLIFCSCSSDSDSPAMKTADMLDITNTDRDFQGCRSRFEAVISAMKSKVVILENAHNDIVKANAENEYFLEKDFVLTGFEPFIQSGFEITRLFDSELDEETAKTAFLQIANGAEIVYTSDGKSDFSLQFVSEPEVKEYRVEYNKKQDSFRYVYSVEDSNGERIEEFLEFLKDKDGNYLIQSKTGRCIIGFDKDDCIVSFCYGELNRGEFSFDESLFELKKAEVSDNWVLEKAKSNYISIHTYENRVLIHEDCSSGPWKSIRINEDDFASAFYSVR